MTTREQDLRLNILNTLLTTPHRRLNEIWPVHRDLVEQDPRFYVQLAAWYNAHGDVRDHKEMFVITLAQSRFAGHRDVALAMLREMPPYQVGRVVDFIHGRRTTRKASAAAVKQAQGRTARRQRARQLVGAKSKGAAVAEPKTVVEEFGLFRNVPRSVRTEVERYLREREADPAWLDATLLSARKAVKRLYALLHIKPSDRAQRILFDRDPPEDSRVYALRELAAADTPEDQARAIATHRIPYRVASTVVKQMTPTVVAALIDSMSPQELINNLGALKRRGALDHPQIKSLIDEKLEAAKTNKRVSALKSQKAVEAAAMPEDVRKKLNDVADTQVKAKGRIKRPTALLIDKSASMEVAIDLGKRIGALISTVCDAELHVYAFDAMCYPIYSQGDSLADWDRALDGIKAGGCTSCGAPIRALMSRNQYVEQIVIVTDEGENTAPKLVDALASYRSAMKTNPNVFIVRTPGGCDFLEKQCRRADVEVDVFRFDGDYYSLPNLVPMLSRPSKLELLMEIMEHPLPKRRAA